MEGEAHLQVILHISQKPHLSSSPVRELSLKVPLMESFAEWCPTTTAFVHLSKSPVYERPPHTRFQIDWIRGPHRDARIWRISQHIFQGPQWRSSPSQTFSMEPLQGERRFIHRAPFTISQSPRQISPPPGSPNGAPMEGDDCLQSLFLHILQGPQQGSPPSRFP